MSDRYIETVDGWLDTQTGLEWERETRPRGPWPEHHDLGDGWRVPTVDELCSVVDRSQSYPATTLLGMQSDFYWSASTYAPSPNFAWVVYFNAGYVGAGSKPTNYYLRAVRGPNDPRTRRLDSVLPPCRLCGEEPVTSPHGGVWCANGRRCVIAGPVLTADQWRKLHGRGGE